MSREEEEETSFEPIPHDVICDILSLLPVKSLTRFRSVSSRWNASISNPLFSRSHFSRSLFARYQGDITASLILTFSNDLKCDLYSITIRPNQAHTDPPTRHLTIPDFPDLYVVQSVHGLIALFSRDADSIFICNPYTRRFTKLPQPRTKPETIPSVHFRMTLLGFDPVHNEHKVLDTLLTFTEPNGEMIIDYRVFNVGSNQWRRIEIDNMAHRPFAGFGIHLNRRIRNPGICINGYIYYRAFIRNPKCGVVAAFDVGRETFRFIRNPMRYHNFVIYTVMMEHEGHLALVDCKGGNNNLSIWVLEDEENEIWVENTIEIPWGESGEREDFSFVGTTITGELIFAPDGLVNQYCLFFCDIKTLTLRKVEIRGLPEFFGYATATDHVESMLSVA